MTTMITSVFLEHTRQSFLMAQPSGKLGKAQLNVCAALARYPDGLTRNELDRALSPGVPNATGSRRLADLERKGAVGRIGSRACSVTGKACDVWAYRPGPKPTPIEPTLPRMPTPKEAEQLAGMLRAEILFGIDHAAMKVLLNWLASGAPRGRESRRIPLELQPTEKKR